MPLTILSIGYSLAPVGPDAVGGAEQVLAALDKALVAAGHQSVVVAPAGSAVAGTLVDSGPLPAVLGEDEVAAARRRQRRAICEAFSRFRIDVVHSHALDFADLLPKAGVPVLVTLHLPYEFYAPGSWEVTRPDTWFNCVSSAQRRNFPAIAGMLPEVENGIDVDRLPARHARRRFALCLGRICPEKGFEHAIDAAERAGIPLMIGGQVFSYQAHLQYFADKIRPRLGPDIRFLGPIGWRRKRRFLNAARCLLVPSLAAETSSLVAMEAIACGTPVIAFPAGALPDIVEPGITGFLVGNASEMAEAILALDEFDRARCREIARRRFSHDRMADRYMAIYRRLATT